MATGLLLVDDELPLLRNLASYLGSFEGEFDVLTAPTAEDALDILEKHGSVSVLLTDIRLPGMDGIELVRRVSDLRPDLSVLVMTAFPFPPERRLAGILGSSCFLRLKLEGWIL